MQQDDVSKIYYTFQTKLNKRIFRPTKNRLFGVI